jgi:hypothetical protein
MKVNLLDMTKKVLYQEYDKPTKEEEQQWEEAGGEGKLYYVIRGEDDQIIEHIDTARVEQVREAEGKKIAPKKVAESLFEQIGIEPTDEFEVEVVTESVPAVKNVEAESEVEVADSKTEEEKDETVSEEKESEEKESEEKESETEESDS